MDFVDFVVSASDSELPGVMAGRVRTLFVESVRRNDIREFSGDTLRLWTADMLLDGLKPSTVRRYVGALHTIYKEWSKDNGGNACADTFAELRSVLAELKIAGNDLAYNFSRIRTVLGITPDSTDFAAACMFLYLLYDVRSTVRDLIDLRFDSFSSDCPQIIDVVERVSDGRKAQYVFPLGHGDNRMPLIIRRVHQSVGTMLANAGFRFNEPFSRLSVTALWIYAARLSGARASDIRAMVPALPDEYSFLSLLPPRSISAAEAGNIMAQVAGRINGRTPRWYVMKLRTGVTPDDVRRRLEASLPRLLPELTFYYPTRTVVKKVKNRNVRTEEPYLPGILFFRAYPERLEAIARHTGGEGWIFRTSNSPGSPYAAISLAEMAKFQRHIGLFTPDVEMQLVDLGGSVDVGHSVRIVGGDVFEGQEGIVTGVLHHNGRNVYSVRLTQSLFIKWNEIEVDGALVEPASLHT